MIKSTFVSNSGRDTNRLYLEDHCHHKLSYHTLLSYREHNHLVIPRVENLDLPRSHLRSQVFDEDFPGTCKTAFHNLNYADDDDGEGDGGDGDGDGGGDGVGDQVDNTSHE